MGQPNPAEGATPPAEPTPEPTKPEPPATDGLGDAGKKALTELRQQIKELEKQNKALQDRDPVKAIAEALGMKPAEAKTDDLAATVKQMQRELADERLGRIRLEVAAAKGLKPAQAKRVQGSTREELEADADDLLETFRADESPTTPSGTPAPDPTQGARGGANDIDARIAAAEAKGKAGVRELIRLKEEKAAQARK